MGRARVAIPKRTTESSSIPSREVPRAATLLYATGIVQAAIFVALPAASGYFHSLGLAETAYGAIFLPMLAVAAVSSLIGPRVQQRLSLRSFYRVGLLCDLLMVGALALAPSAPSILPWVLGIGALVLGVALGWMGIALNATAVALFPRSRGVALTALHAAVGLGAMLTPVLVRSACEAGRWSLLALVLAGACVALFVIETALWRIPFPESSGDAPTTTAPNAAFAPTRPRPTDLRAAAGAFLYGVAEATIASWAVLFLTGKGISGQDAARSLSAFWCAVTVGRLAAVPMLRVFSPVSVAAFFVVLQFVSFLWIGTVETPTQALLAYALAGLGASALFPIVLTMATLDTGAPVARTTAIVTAGLMIGLGVGAFLVGPLSRLVPMEIVFRASAIWPLGLMTWLWLGRRRSLRVQAAI